MKTLSIQICAFCKWVRENPEMIEEKRDEEWFEAHLRLEHGMIK